MVCRKIMWLTTIWANILDFAGMSWWGIRDKSCRFISITAMWCCGWRLTIHTLKTYTVSNETCIIKWWILTLVFVECCHWSGHERRVHETYLSMVQWFKWMGRKILMFCSRNYIQEARFTRLYSLWVSIEQWAPMWLYLSRFFSGEMPTQQWNGDRSEWWVSTVNIERTSAAQSDNRFTQLWRMVDRESLGSVIGPSLR